MKLLLAQGAHADARDQRHVTPFMAANASGRLEIVRMLLDNVAHINARDDDDRTVLLHAAYLL